MTRVRAKPGRTFQWIALGLAALGLVVLLGNRAGLTANEIWRTVAGFPVWAFICFLALSAANLAIGTWKWLLVMRTSASGEERQFRFVDAMLTTTLGELLGQAMPVQAGVALSRSVAGRFGVGLSARTNLGTTVYEQAFDAVALAAAAAMGVAAFALRPGPAGWIVLVLLAAACSLAISLRLAVFVRIAVRIASMCLPRKWTRLSGLEGVAYRVGQFRKMLLVQLALLSLLRYAVNLGRIVALLAGVGLIAYAGPTIIAFPLVLGIALLPITPGNLGINEWSWSVVLISAGATMNDAGLFAISARIIAILAMLFLTLLLFAMSRVSGGLAIFHSQKVG